MSPLADALLRLPRYHRRLHGSRRNRRRPRGFVGRFRARDEVTSALNVKTLPSKKEKERNPPTEKVSVRLRWKNGTEILPWSAGLWGRWSGRRAGGRRTTVADRRAKSAASGGRWQVDTTCGGDMGKDVDVEMNTLAAQNETERTVKVRLRPAFLWILEMGDQRDSSSGYIHSRLLLLLLLCTTTIILPLQTAPRNRSRDKLLQSKR